MLIYNYIFFVEKGIKLEFIKAFGLICGKCLSYIFIIRLWNVRRKL